jgi:NADH:ubiquinone oxidoreductase subunit 5 (subunit L)/multisubunit Na+/H+ antiporter MnhA subunit
MASQTLLLLTVFVPLAGSILLPIAGKISKKFRNALAMLFVLVPFGLLLYMLPMALSQTPPYFSVTLPLGLSFGFLADGLAVFMAMASSFLGLIIVLYSYGYVTHAENQNEYYMEVVLFIGAMMGITLTTNLIFLYVFWEISAVCCWRLIGFFREKEYVRRANKAFLITGIGALIMLCGFLLIYQQYCSAFFPNPQRCRCTPGLPTPVWPPPQPRLFCTRLCW